MEADSDGNEDVAPMPYGCTSPVDTELNASKSKTAETVRTELLTKPTDSDVHRVSMEEGDGVRDASRREGDGDIVLV